MEYKYNYTVSQKRHWRCTL